MVGVGGPITERVFGMRLAEQDKGKELHVQCKSHSQYKEGIITYEHTSHPSNIKSSNNMQPKGNYF